MKLKRWLPLLLVFSLLLSSAAFAAEDKTHLDIQDTTELFAQADLLDKSGKTYDEHIVIDFALQNIKSGVDYNDGDILTKWFTQHFNMEWNIEAIPNEGGDDKIRTMINSDSMTDVLRWDSFYIDEVIDYIDQGYFYQFPEDWKERWPKLASLQDVVPAAELLRDRTDGNTYTLFRPIFYFNNPTENNTTHFGIYLRKDWAEAVGFELKDVYTPSEILEYARLVKENDPGKIGERLVPLSLYTTNARDLFIGQSYPQYSSLYKEDGTYKWGFADERTLEGLKLWQTAYNEGLIGKEFYTLNSDDSKNAYAVSGVSGGFANAANEGWVGGCWFDMISQGLDPEEAFWVAAVVGDDGFFHGTQSYNHWGNVFFSADIDEEVFERYMDIAEFCVDREVSRLVNIGFEGLDWEYADKKNDVISKINGAEFATMWPIYHLMSICGDDFIHDSYNVSDLSFLGDRFSKKIYATKDALVTEGSIMPIDKDTYGFTSNAQNMLSEVNYKTLLANLIVAEGDLETNWKAAIAEYAYIIDPALAELNELFGDK